MRKKFRPFALLGAVGLMLVSFESYADVYQYTLVNNTNRDLQCAVGWSGKKYILDKENQSQSVTFYNFYISCEPMIDEGSSDVSSNCTFAEPPRTKDLDTVKCYIQDSSGNKKATIKATLDPNGTVTFTEEAPSDDDSASNEKKIDKKPPDNDAAETTQKKQTN